MVCLLEALVAIGFSVAEASQIRTSRLVVGAGTALLMCGYGAFLAAVSRGVWLGRRWSRAPAVATQLLHLPIAWSFNGGNTTFIAWILLVLSALALVCLLLPSSTAIFLRDELAGEDSSAPDRSS
ncbi:MAG: hypothetical protein AVDCRST_MAG75-2693 [uncultured Propionibacteriaceae bacterium]|uniref:Integral membrane protein n=1 Tax=uncultured Propionibacteriaceae bacterium TaxID=257457 RepID=A0A6J4P9R8_9ACTN|nr:MAG: hypothetical protein AVDCRST_MAG75-2693 [uncultured Propionibacteriaceae bacterium]